MSLANDVYSALKSEYDSGLTQVEIATRHHVRQGQIQHILSGKRSARGLQLDTVDKMFPNATVNLYGDKVSIPSDLNCSSGVEGKRGTLSSDCISAVIDIIMASEALTSDEKVKVFNVLKKRVNKWN